MRVPIGIGDPEFEAEACNEDLRSRTTPSEQNSEPLLNKTGDSHREPAVEGSYPAGVKGLHRACLSNGHRQSYLAAPRMRTRPDLCLLVSSKLPL